METVPPQPGDVVQWITIRLHGDGMLSTCGTIADRRMALHLLDHARDSIKRSVPEYRALVIPGSEVEIAPVLPVRELGTLPPALRGDP